MSDEEKNVIDLLKNIDKQKCLMLKCPVVKNNIERQLKIIELNRIIRKQSKEIEELKSQIDEHVYYDLGGRSCGKTELLRHYKKGYDMNNKFWKDKIKAKIEEYREQIEELKDLNIFTYTEYKGAIKFGQSLLEKE